jgi:hypothetical protein
VLRTRGYVLLRRWLSQCKVRHASSASGAAEQSQALAAVDRAAVYYPREARCLQRSVVVTWLLRKKGLPAKLVIGCRHTPFYAHAWVEVDGIVMNDRESVKELYPEIERI